MKRKEKQRGILKSLVSTLFQTQLLNISIWEANNEERGRSAQAQAKDAEGQEGPGCTWSSGQSSVGSRAGVNRLDWAQEARYTESKRDKSRW